MPYREEALPDEDNNLRLKEVASKAKEHISKKVVHELMGDNTPVLGCSMLAEKKILEVRSERERVSDEKSKLRRYIMNMSTHLPTSTACHLRPARDYSGSWQRHLHTKGNDLNLNGY